MVARRVAERRAVRLPPGGRQPDLAVPDHVEHAEPVGVAHEEGGEVVAVELVLPARVSVAETAAERGEVAGAALRMLERAAGAEARDEPLEPEPLGLPERELQPRRD